MTRTVQNKIIEIIAEQAVLDPSEVSIDMTIEELGLDSLGLVEAVFAIEENFEISVPFFFYCHILSLPVLYLNAPAQK